MHAIRKGRPASRRSERHMDLSLLILTREWTEGARPPWASRVSGVRSVKNDLLVK